MVYPAATNEELFTVVQSDWLFRMPSVHLVDARVGGGGHVHVYELTYPAPASPHVLGACHALDVSLVFGTMRHRPDLFGATVPDEAGEVATAMQRSWIDFSLSGDPGWPSFDTPAA